MHVQGESLKAYAALHSEASQLPDHQDGEIMKRLISPEYAEQNRVLHQSPTYGASQTADLEQGAKSIIALANHLGVRSILDYGCGKGHRAALLRIRAPMLEILEFDPAIPGKEMLPSSADMVIAVDVMEHIEPEYLDNVLGAIRDICTKVFVSIIALTPSSRILSDGRNAHLILQRGDWWEREISKHFRIEDSQPIQHKGKITHYGITAVPLN